MKLRFGNVDALCECGGVITEYPDGVFTCSECTFYEEDETLKTQQPEDGFNAEL